MCSCVRMTKLNVWFVVFFSQCLLFIHTVHPIWSNGTVQKHCVRFVEFCWSIRATCTCIIVHATFYRDILNTYMCVQSVCVCVFFPILSSDLFKSVLRMIPKMILKQTISMRYIRFVAHLNVLLHFMKPLETGFQCDSAHICIHTKSRQRQSSRVCYRYREKYVSFVVQSFHFLLHSVFTSDLHLDFRAVPFRHRALLLGASMKSSDSKRDFVWAKYIDNIKRSEFAHSHAFHSLWNSKHPFDE